MQKCLVFKHFFCNFAANFEMAIPNHYTRMVFEIQTETIKF